jgi:DNA mismatch endonuclease (patch repair protein)
MQATPRRDTPCELAIRSAVHRLGLRFRVDWPLPGTRRRADLAFTRTRVAVFVDGCFWHGCPIHGTWPKANAAWWRDKIEKNVERDRNTTRALTDAGWRVLRFWEHDNMASAARRIARTVRELAS